SNGSLSHRTFGIEAGVRKIVSIFRRAGQGQPQAKGRGRPSVGFWRIDLASLGGAITATRTEPVNLPGKPKRSPARAQARPNDGGDSTPARVQQAGASQARRRSDAAPPRVDADVSKARIPHA